MNLFLLIIYSGVALAALAFIFIYFPRYWWTHPTGVSIMATKTAIFGAAVAQIEHALTGGVTHDSVVYLASSGVLLFGVMVLRVILLRKALVPPDTAEEQTQPASETSEGDPS